MALKGLMTFELGNLHSYIFSMELKGKRVERKAISMKSFKREPLVRNGGKFHGNNVPHAV